MPCMCGDSQCPSCGLAQGTLERSPISHTETGMTNAEFTRRYNTAIHARIARVVGFAPFRPSAELGVVEADVADLVAAGWARVERVLSDGTNLYRLFALDDPDVNETFKQEIRDGKR